MDPTELLQEHLPEAAVTAALALKHVDPDSTRLEDAEGVPVMLTQPDLRITSLERLLPGPLVPAISVNLYTKRDLASYIGAQAVKQAQPSPGGTIDAEGEAVVKEGVNSDHVVVFADRNALSFIAWLDYHRPGRASWLRHQVRVAYEHSHQFKRWKANDGKKMPQEEFASFLDENVNDIVNPSGADVVTFASQLEVTRTERFKSATNLANGEVSFTFTNEASGDSTVKFPTEMTIEIPFWLSGDRIAVKAKLYYRVIQGSLTFWYKLMMIDETKDHLFEEDTVWLKNALTSIGTLYRGPAPAAQKPLELDV